MPGDAISNAEFPGLTAQPGTPADAEPDPRSHLARRQMPVVPTPRATTGPRSRQKRPRQFSKRESHFTNATTFRFSGGLSSREHLPGKGSNSPAHAHRRCWLTAPVSLTRITSVPECAVSSVGFLWGSAAVSRRCGVSVGSQEALDLPDQ